MISAKNHEKNKWKKKAKTKTKKEQRGDGKMIVKKGGLNDFFVSLI